MEKPSREELRAAFERCCRLPGTLKHVQFPLGAVTVNDQFHHYVDSDTDSAWMGFVMGLNACLKKVNAQEQPDDQAVRDHQEA